MRPIPLAALLMLNLGLVAAVLLVEPACRPEKSGSPRASPISSAAAATARQPAAGGATALPDQPASAGTTSQPDQSPAALPAAPTDRSPPPSTTASAPATAPAADWVPPVPKSAGERREERARMVEAQIATALDGRIPVRSAAVLEAMRTVPRHVFVPERVRAQAYADRPLPIGEDQTISQPYMVAIMTELLEVTPTCRILEIGTGSGYQAAVLAQLTPQVYSIEIVAPLAERAAATLRAEGCTTVQVRCGDGYAGWPAQAPFDRIIVTCAPPQLPPALWEQLRPGGRLVMPLGAATDVQDLVVIRKTEAGQKVQEQIMPVRFVPMTGSGKR